MPGGQPGGVPGGVPGGTVGGTPGGTPGGVLGGVPGGGTGSAGSAGSRTGSADPSGGGGSSSTPGGAQTAEERRAAIDRKLDDSLGTFDGELRKEQERVARERDARQASGEGTANTDGHPGSDSTASGDKSGAGTTEAPAKDTQDKADHDKRGNADKDKKGSRAGDLKSDKAGSVGGSGSATGNGATAREIPDGSDDDVVARRLRKAAEQETDPELKDKLWKEYIDYKKNAQGR